LGEEAMRIDIMVNYTKEISTWTMTGKKNRTYRIYRTLCTVLRAQHSATCTAQCSLRSR
jgi:hypothetical protein